jgi:hypothetical protein
MLDEREYAFTSEFCIVEKTIQLVCSIGGESTSVRIEALHDPRTGKYRTRVYEEVSCTVQITYPQNREPEDREIWLGFRDLSWTHRDTAEDAISQALEFLRDMCDKE